MTRQSSAPPKFPRWRSEAHRGKKGFGGWWDTWGHRINNASQLGLFSLGLIGFFYVVLPVYQKSVLEEAVAKLQTDLKAASQAVEKREAELRTASTQLAAVQGEAERTTKELDRSYRQLRAYGVVHLTFFLGPQCSGMLVRPLPLLRVRDPIPDPLDSARRYLEVHPRECIEKQFSAWKFRDQLRPNDLRLIQENINRIAIESEKERTQTLAQLNSLTDRAKADPSILLPAEGEILVPQGVDKEYVERIIFRSRLSRTGYELVSKYGDAVRKRIEALNALKWDDGTTPRDPRSKP